MAFRKFFSPLSIVGAVVLMFGLGISVVGLQAPQDNRSRADWSGGSCNQQGQSSQNCCSRKSDIISRTGWTDVAAAGSCHDDTVFDCPGSGGRWVPSNIWLCPGGNHIRCCVPIVQSQPQPQACGDTTAPTGILISHGATVTASNTIDANVPKNAVDGDQNTSWNAGNYPPQWIEINLGSKKTVTGLKLYVNQDPNGHTVNQIYAGSTSNPGTLVKTLDCTTSNNQTINVVFSQPLTDTQYIRINTPTGVSWVAWKEIEVYGQDAPQADTTISLTAYIHGIGKGGTDAINWTGDDPIDTRKVRNVSLEIDQITNDAANGCGQKLGEGTGTLQYADGKYTTPSPIHITNVGDGIPPSTSATNYCLRVISGSGYKTEPRPILGGQPNSITMTLDTGDANYSHYIDASDYDMILKCVTDAPGKIPNPKECNSDQAAQSDINDDGKVSWDDLNLLIKQFAFPSH